MNSKTYPSVSTRQNLISVDDNMHGIIEEEEMEEEGSDIEEEVEEPEDPAWTYKFLIPTSVAIATLVILGNVIQYFRQVTRKRYKVKE